MMSRWTLALLALVLTNCQTTSRTDAHPDAGKYDHSDTRKDSRPDSRSNGRWYLQRPSSY